MIAATVSEGWRHTETHTHMVMRQKIRVSEEENRRGAKRNAKHDENATLGYCCEYSQTHADKQKGTHLQKAAAKLFVHGESKQETNQLQKSMST